ncbi:hypothetical protein ElyMa_006113300 [Elysia marginata]|uniref:Uncharacterized protein n=1 Tax=Elysia marginata TaxID=1093978 RepID=A0AAV4GUV8_9GAST|nr:hypothetical protein ElyMa_006113300 [Elysia marginata]
MAAVFIKKKEDEENNNHHNEKREKEVGLTLGLPSGDAPTATSAPGLRSSRTASFPRRAGLRSRDWRSAASPDLSLETERL